MQKKIELKKDYTKISIYIEGILHVNFDLDNYVAMQSYLTTDKIYHIEICFQQGRSLLLGYSDRNLWISILKLIDANI